MTNIKSSVDQKRADQLQAILFLLQTNLEEMKEEVDRSYALLKVGEKTDLSKKIENTMNNPLNSIFELSINIDDQIKSIIDRSVKNFLKFHREIIHSSIRTKTYLNDLHYSIALNNDNIENRVKIFEFLNKFELLDISIKYPVYFQFVPVELIDKINVSEIIKLDNPS